MSTKVRSRRPTNDWTRQEQIAITEIAQRCKRILEQERRYNEYTCTGRDEDMDSRVLDNFRSDCDNYNLEQLKRANDSNQSLKQNALATITSRHINYLSNFDGRPISTEFRRSMWNEQNADVNWQSLQRSCKSFLEAVQTSREIEEKLVDLKEKRESFRRSSDRRARNRQDEDAYNRVKRKIAKKEADLRKVQEEESSSYHSADYKASLFEETENHYPLPSMNTAIASFIRDHHKRPTRFQIQQDAESLHSQITRATKSIEELYEAGRKSMCNFVGINARQAELKRLGEEYRQQIQAVEPLRAQMKPFRSLMTEEDFLAVITPKVARKLLTDGSESIGQELNAMFDDDSDEELQSAVLARRAQRRITVESKEADEGRAQAVPPRMIAELDPTPSLRQDRQHDVTNGQDSDQEMVDCNESEDNEVSPEEGESEDGDDIDTEDEYLHSGDEY